jgi:hypothetical protein
MYTFWYYMRNRWERKWRSASRPHSAVFRFDGAPTRRRRIRGMEGASDHAPVWMKLRDAPAAAALLFDRSADRRQLRQRRLCRKRSDRPIGLAAGRDREAPQRESVSPLSRVARCWSLTGTPSLIDLHALPKTIRRSDDKGPGVGQLGGADETLRNVSRLSKRARVRRRSWGAIESVYSGSSAEMRKQRPFTPAHGKQRRRIEVLNREN